MNKNEKVEELRFLLLKNTIIRFALLQKS